MRKVVNVVGYANYRSYLLSLVYFTGPHPDTVVECLQAGKCAPADGGAPRYAPITAYDHVLAKMHAATADGREAVSECFLGGGKN